MARAESAIGIRAATGLGPGARSSPSSGPAGGLLDRVVAGTWLLLGMVAGTGGRLRAGRPPVPANEGVSSAFSWWCGEIAGEEPLS
jgi:hypothetical protein